MEIQVNDTYRLTSNEKNVFLEEKKIAEEGKNKGKEYYADIGAYPNIEVALERLITKVDNKSLVNSLEELKELRKELHKDIKQLVKKYKGCGCNE